MQQLGGHSHPPTKGRRPLNHMPCTHRSSHSPIPFSLCLASITLFSHPFTPLARSNKQDCITPLYAAAWWGHAQAVEVLLKEGAMPDMPGGVPHIPPMLVSFFFYGRSFGCFLTLHLCWFGAGVWCQLCAVFEVLLVKEWPLLNLPAVISPDLPMLLRLHVF